MDPMVNTTTKTVRVRVELENPDGHLRPGDEATVEMSVPTGMGGKLYDPQLAGKWICPRHPDVTGSAGDTCPHEGTPMVPTASYGFATTPNELDQPVLVPRDAVLMAGDHSAVYVETEPGRYEFRRVNVRTLGATRSSSPAVWRLESWWQPMGISSSTRKCNWLGILR